MKKKRWMLLLPLLALAALVLAALRLGGARVLTVDMAQLEASAERDLMQASLTYDAGTRTLRGRQTLLCENRTGEALQEAVLRLPMNTLSEDSVTVSAVTADGQAVPFSLDAEDPTVLRIALDWQPGQRVQLAWTLMVKHAEADGAALITLPALAVYEAGAWRTDGCDELVEPIYAQAFDYTLDLIARDETQAAFGGALTACRWETGIGESLYIARMRGAREVSFALLPAGEIRQKEIDGVLVTALAQTAPAARRLLGHAQTAIESLEKAGFAYPFPSLTIAESDTGREDGLALSGLIALSADGDQEAQLRRVTRLAARQTFGVLVENDPWNAPWLSHTLASTAELLAYRERKGDGAFETRYFEEIEVATRLTRPMGVTVGAGTAFFGSDAEMTQVLRDQGAAMLLGIESAIGREAFLTALQAYVRDNAGGIAAQADLETALLEVTGSDWSGYLADELSW